MLILYKSTWNRTSASQFKHSKLLSSSLTITFFFLIVKWGAFLQPLFRKISRRFFKKCFFHGSASSKNNSDQLMVSIFSNSCWANNGLIIPWSSWVLQRKKFEFFFHVFSSFGRRGRHFNLNFFLPFSPCLSLLLWYSVTTFEFYWIH